MIHEKIWRELGDPILDFNERTDDLLQLFYDQCTYPVRLQLMNAIETSLQEQLGTQLFGSHGGDLFEESEDTL